MDLTKLGTNTWTEPGVNPDYNEPLKGFRNDASNVNQLTSSVGDLLHLSRTRTSTRQFVQSNSPSSIPEKKAKKMANSTSDSKLPQAIPRRTRDLNAENPVSRGEVIDLESELQERVKTVMLLEEYVTNALHSGQVYQPNKDRYILLKSKLQNELQPGDTGEGDGPWLDRLAKCESLLEICDDISARLASMVSVHSCEMGNVLRAVRSTYRQSVSEMKASWRLLFDRFSEVNRDLYDRTEEVQDLTEQLREKEKIVREEGEAQMDDMKKYYDQQHAADMDDLRKSEFQIEQMSETLKNLNGIFKTMQNDVDVSRASDALSKCKKLEKDVEELNEKCAAVGYLKKQLADEVAKSASLYKDLELQKAQNEALRAQLARRDESVSELMEKEALRTAEIDKLERMAALRNEADEALELAEPPTSVLCIKCKKSLDDLSNLRSAILGVGRGDERVQCQNYRVLLPNLRGKRPHRTVDWVRYCMRAMLACKMREASSLLPIYADVSRFPEFVYAWFEPDSDKFMNSREPQVLQNQADEDRWGFYYGVKLLTADDPEAKLIWALLDETHGEDGLTFVCYCMSVALSIGGVELWRQFGDTLDYNSTSMGKFMGTGSYSVDRVVWLDLKSAKEAVRHILVRALKPQIQEILESIDALKEVPKFDEPRVDDEGSVSASSASEEIAESSSAQETSVAGSTPVDVDAAGQEPTHVNFFIWLRLLLLCFQEEQSHRSAAIRLMFDTSSIGALTPQVQNPTAAVSSGQATNEDGPDGGNHAEFPQFQAIMRTLHGEISSTEIASLYAQCYAEGRRRVTAAVFMRVAERRGFFSRAMQFSPLPVLSGQADFNKEGSLDQAEQVVREALTIRTQLGASIHRRVVQFTPALNKMAATLPERWRCLILNAMQAVEDAVTDSFEVSNKKKRRRSIVDNIVKESGAFNNLGIDGLQPYVMYRRLMTLALAAKTFGDNPLIPTELLPRTRLDSKSGAYVKMNQIKLPRVEVLLDGLESAVLNNRKASKTLFDVVRMCVASRSIQRSYRNFITTDIFMPCSLRVCMRPGYLSGKGDLKSRRVYLEPWVASAMISEAYRFKVLHDQKAAGTGLPPLPLTEATVASQIQFWGNVELAERAIQDLCLAVRTYQHALPRLRLFSLFIGDNSSELDPLLFNVMNTELAVDRYLDLVVALHGAGMGEIEDEGETQEPAEEGIHEGILQELFPSSGEDLTLKNDKRDPWTVSTARVSGAVARWSRHQGGVSALAVEEAIKKLTEDDEGKVDADEALWLLMTAWARGMSTLEKMCKVTILRDVKLANPDEKLALERAQTPIAVEAVTATSRRNLPNRQPVDIHFLNDLLSRARATGEEQHPNAITEKNGLILASQYIRVLRAGTDDIVMTGDQDSKRKRRKEPKPPIESLLRQAVLWNSHMVDVLEEEGESERDQVVNTGIPRRLLIDIVSGTSPGTLLFLIKRAWTIQKELYDKLLKEVEAELEQTPNTSVKDTQEIVETSKALLAKTESAFDALEKFARQRVASNASGNKYKSQETHRKDPLAREQLMDAWNKLQLLISSISDISYATKRAEYPRDLWRGGKKIHMDKSPAYR